MNQVTLTFYQHWYLCIIIISPPHPSLHILYFWNWRHWYANKFYHIYYIFIQPRNSAKINGNKQLFQSQSTPKQERYVKDGRAGRESKDGGGDRFAKFNPGVIGYVCVRNRGNMRGCVMKNIQRLSLQNVYVYQKGIFNLRDNWSLMYINISKISQKKSHVAGKFCILSRPVHMNIWCEVFGY